MGAGEQKEYRPLLRHLGNTPTPDGYLSKYTPWNLCAIIQLAVQGLVYYYHLSLEGIGMEIDVIINEGADEKVAVVITAL